MRKFRFYKNELGWFIDLKYWPFSKGHLAMVAGADTLLDKLSVGKDEIYLEISPKNPEYQLHRKLKLGLLSGAVYEPIGIEIESEIFDGANLLWLCFVTIFVFGYYPKEINFNVK